MTGYEKRGYLNSDFRLFHLTDTKNRILNTTTTISIKLSSSSEAV